MLPVKALSALVKTSTNDLFHSRFTVKGVLQKRRKRPCKQVFRDLRCLRHCSSAVYMLKVSAKGNVQLIKHRKGFHPQLKKLQHLTKLRECLGVHDAPSDGGHQERRVSEKAKDHPALMWLWD